MHLMCYAPIDWLDVVAIRVEGTVSNWMNVVLQDVAIGHKPMFHMWDQFKESMVQQFELVTGIEEARKQLCALRQTSQVTSYVQKF